MMSEPKPQSKSKNKKKKKSKAVAQAEIPPVVDCASIGNTVVKLPQKLNESTYINEVLVTMTEKKDPSKKKNGKKQNKNENKSNVNSLENGKNESTISNAEQPLLNFSRTGIAELKNLPEITVTPTVGLKANPSVVNEVPPVEQPVNDSTNPPTATKKKKKKKKKKSANQSTQEESKTSEDGNPEANASEPTVNVEKPTSGDSLVLVISHESFKGNANINDSSAKQGANQTDAVQNITLKNPLHGSHSFCLPPPPQSMSAPSTITTSCLNSKPKLFGSLSPIYDVRDVSSETNTVSSPKLPYVELKVVDDKKPPPPAIETTNQKVKHQAEKKASEEVQKVTKLAVKSLDAHGPANVPEQNLRGKVVKPKVVLVKEKKSIHVRLFSHLPQYKSLSTVYKHLESKTDIHPAVVAVAAQCAEGIIQGSTARCVALLGALKSVVEDYVTPPNKELSRELESKIQECVNFISKCRPLSVSMANAVKVITHYITDIPSNATDDEAKVRLCTQITKFVEEEICLAKKAISENAADVIKDGDVILTYAYSSVVKDALCQAFVQKKSFRVIVVDSRPKMEGKQMLKCLLKEGIDCSYIFISGIAYIMHEVTKVIIGAHALQANGYVMSRVGSSQIALVSSFYNVPYLVCCETYKFCERVHTDSFVYNELGDPESLVNTGPSENSILENWKDIEKLQLLNLLYDITPPEFISVIITEKGELPHTSVPVVLRARHSGTHSQLLPK